MTDKRLAGKWALVTGSTRGLGRVIAEWLAADGAAIVVSGREEADVAASVTAIKALGVDAIGIPADLSQVTEAHRLAEAAIAAVPALDILVNNAGMSIRGNFWDVSDADWDYQVNVNVRSPFIIAQHAARHMIERETHGRIVNISTIGVHSCHHNAAVYNLAKAAVEGMTKNMSFELGPYGINVNCVAPGNIAIRPGMLESPWFPQAINAIPLGRLGHGEDIAAAVRFFCLPESSFTTGQTLLVDGGHNSYLTEMLDEPINSPGRMVKPRRAPK
ncbi:MAG TPA: SDR family oxidoreductase [Thermomicrobiales bacterium]|nr:SDR family oxidoreductase [Thermomicrobiales bacterium]HRA48373.1 SDR family oxidoreductase [Thermomicrobiales bacterium]